MKKKDEHKLYNSNFLEACNNAVNGIIYATTTQSNIKKQLVIAVIVMILSLFFDLSRAEFLCLTFAVFFVIFAEMVNTAIETIVDLYTDLYHPKAKIAKDVGAGAVVLTAINALIVAYFLFFDKIGFVGTTILDAVINSPMHLALVAIILTVIAVVAVKAANVKSKKNPMAPQFIPSGQTAIAFAALTAICINTNNIVVFTLSLIMALMVGGNRIENKARSFSEITFGACMGVIIVILVYALTILKN